ncbi:MAG: carboxypeptidase-like regulatory domain-containing protein [archaeon]
MVGLISEKLSGVYTKVEDKYFDLLDALDNKGLPVYAYSDFFEDKGIPSLIVTIAIIFLLIMVIGLAVSGPAIGSGDLVLTLRDSVTNQPIQNATITLFDESNNKLKTIIASDGDKITLAGYPQSTKIQILVAKEGYANGQSDFLVGANASIVPIYLSKDFVGIEAKLRITNSETGSKINNAVVSARYGDQIYNFYVDANGLYSKSNIPQGETLLLTITSDGYAPVEVQASFFQGTIKDYTMSPSGDSFVGLAKLVITISDIDGKAIDGADVKIYNTQNQAILLNQVSEQGAISGNIQTQIPIKIVVSKEGYLIYDSDVTLGGITIVNAEEKLDLILSQGGEEITVNVVSDLGLNLSDAIVQIFDQKGNQIARAISTNNGADFFGLDADQIVIITAFKEGYLPKQTQIYVGTTQTVPIVLKEALSGNSYRIDLFTTDSQGDSIPGTNILVNVFDEDGNKIPYGFEDIRSNIAGYVSVVVDLGKTYEILAETNIMHGSKVVEINENTPDNKVYIMMFKKENVVQLKLVDLLGNAVLGTGIVSSLTNEVLFDGNITNSSIFFNATNKDVVLVEISTLDGVEYAEEVYVKGKEEVTLTIYDKENSDLSPIIEFIGLETETGEETNGITPGAFYYAKFSVKWPLAAQKGGVHFRSGSDSVEFVDSQNFAIFDLSLKDSQNFFSYSYNPTPSPGDEALDRSNQGYVDEPIKWVEGIINQPNGNYTAKVKIRASKFSAGKVSLQYRAWSEVDDSVYRTPVDADLGETSFTEGKAELYADTSKVDITLYESLPECTDNICISYNFADEEGNYYDLLNFEALEGKVYALETEFTSIETDYLQLNFTTDSNLNFLGTQTSNFSFMQDSQYLNSNEASTPVSLTANGKQKVRIYFVARGTGTNLINLTASGNTEITKELAFQSVTQKEMLVELTEKKIPLGRDISIKVLESNLQGIPNALIKVINKDGEVVKSVVGDGREDVGKNGKYKIANDLEQGVYIVEVSAGKYKTKTEAILITAQEVLSVEQEISVKMLQNEKKKTIQLQLTNNSEFDVKNLVITGTGETFTVLANTIPLLSKNSNQSISINIEYIGDSNEANETVTLDIKGMIEGKFLTATSTKLNLSYNQKIDQSCLKLTPKSIKIAMVGNNGASTNETIEVKNDCEDTVTLTAVPVEKTRRSNIKVTSSDITLQPGRTQIVTINATNLMDRSFNQNETYNYEIRYESDRLTKVLPVTVELISPRIALSYPGQITLFLAQDKVGAKAIASQPIFVTNVSQFSVEGIKFSQSSEYAPQSNVSVKIVPPETVALLAGQAMQPKLLFAEASTRFADAIETQINITGKLSGLDNRIGTQDNYNYADVVSGKTSINNYNNSSTGYTSSENLLGVINVLIYYSGFDCLKTNLDTTAFYLSAEGLGRSTKLTVNNSCAEAVRLLDVKASYPGLLFSVPNIIIGPNQTVETQMMLGVQGNSTKLTNFPITIRGLTEGSQTVIESKPIPVEIYAGVNYNEEYSQADEGITAKTCDGKEVTISIPKDAVNGDCSNGYCDGAEAAEYIAKKLDTAIKTANTQAYSAQKQDDQLFCMKKGFCTLGDIGIQKTSFDLYLKNDTFGKDALRDAFAKYGKSTQGFIGIGEGDYQFDTGKIDVRTLGEIASRGYGHQVIIDDTLSGCGYYKLLIDGVFPINAEGVNFLSPILTVQVQPIIGNGKITTKECSNSIENLSNFTPIDKLYTIGNTGGTWLTTIEADKALTDMGKSLSKKIVGDEKRFGLGIGNKIILKEAALGTTLAEVCLINGEKSVVEVKVNSGLVNQNETAQAGFEQEVVNLITNAIKGNFGNNCLTPKAETYNCVQLKNFENPTDKLNLKLDTPNLNITKNGGCVTGIVSSAYPETVEFSFSKLSDKKEFSNISRITVSENKVDGNILFDFYLNKKDPAVNKKTSLEQRTNNVDAKYSREIKICAYSDEQSYLHTQGVQFIIKAINKDVGKRETEVKDGTITIGTDSLHPDDLLNIITNKNVRALIGKRGENNPYYFTITWDNDPQILENLNTYYSNLVALGLLEDTLVVNPDGTAASTTAGNKLLQDSRTKALGAYFGTCLLVTTTCNLGTGLAAGIFNGLTDCALPAMTVFRADVAEFAPFMKDFYGILGEIPFFGDYLDIPSGLPDPKNWNPFEPAVGVGAVGGALEKVTANIKLYAKDGGLGVINTQADDWIEAQMKESYKKSFTDTIKGTFKVPDATLTTELAEGYSNAVSKKTMETFELLKKEALKRKVPIIGKRPTLTPDEVNEFMKQASAKGIEEGPKYLKGAEAKRLIQGISGTTTDNVDELISKLRSGAVINSNVNELNILGKVETTTYAKIDSISDDLLLGLTDGSPEAINTLRGGINTQVSAIVDDLTRAANLETPVKNKLISDIMDKFDDAKIKTLMNNRTNKIKVKNALLPDDQLRIIKDAIKRDVRDAVTDVIKLDPTLGKITTAQLDNLGKVIADNVGSTAKAADFTDVTKRTLNVKLKELFTSGKMWGSIARGFGCGVISNMAGIGAYNKYVATSSKTVNETMDMIPQTSLIKGETYKMIVEDKIKGNTTATSAIKPNISRVDTTDLVQMKAMQDALEGKGAIKGVTLSWSEKVNPKRPEERPLKEYLLSVNAAELLKVLPGEAGFSKEVAIEIKNAIVNPYAQKLIQRYTNKDKGKDLLKIKDQIIPESWAVAIIALDNDFTNENLKTEYTTDKEVDKKLKARLIELIKLAEENGQILVEDKISNKMYKDEKTAQQFTKLITAWDKLTEQNK